MKIRADFCVITIVSFKYFSYLCKPKQEKHTSMSVNYQITNLYDDNLYNLSEEDIKNRYITPAI